MNSLHPYKWVIFIMCFAAVVQAALVDDFESGTGNNLLGGKWSGYNDASGGGNSKIVNAVLAEGDTVHYTIIPTAGEGHSGAGMVVKYEYGTIRPHNETDTYGYQVGINTTLPGDSSGAGNLTGATRISFWAKSNPSGLVVHLQVPITDVKDYGWHQIPVTLTSAWTKYSIKLDTLKQAAWVVKKTFNPAHVSCLQWEINESPVDSSGRKIATNPKSGTLWLDDVEVEGYNPILTSIINIVPSNSTVRRPLFSWHPVASAVNYSVQVYCSPVSKNPVWDSSTIKIAVTDTFFIPSADLNPGYVYWRVKSNISVWSATGVYRILDARIPTPIQVPSPTVIRRPLLKWYASQAAAASYALQVSATSNFASPLISAPVADTFYQTITDLPLGTIYWRVKSDSSEYSAVSSFTINDGRIPVIESQESPTFNRKPTMRWRKSAIAVTNYTIQISTGGAFSAGTVVVESPITDTFYTCAADLPIGVIYWRVKGDDSQYSQPGSFTISDSRIPVLKPITPKIINTSKPVLEWHMVPGAASYTFEIANSSAFTSTLISAPVADSFYTITVPLAIGTYYWHVKSNLVETWSSIDNFTIQPDSIPFIARYDGATTENKRPVFKWNKVSGAASYRFMLADNRSFTSAINMPLADTVYTPTVDLASAKWYWKVSCDRNLDLFCLPDSLIIGTNTAVIARASSGKNEIKIAYFRTGISFTSNYALTTGALRIYDLSGRSVATPVIATNSGYSTAIWNFAEVTGRSVPAGTYVVRIVAKNGAMVRRVTKQ
jgi:hypothetical protein